MDDLKFLLPYQAHMYFSMNTFSVLVWENTKCAMNVWKEHFSVDYYNLCLGKRCIRRTDPFKMNEDMNDGVFDLVIFDRQYIHVSNGNVRSQR